MLALKEVRSWIGGLAMWTVLATLQCTVCQTSETVQLKRKRLCKSKHKDKLLFPILGTHPLVVSVYYAHSKSFPNMEKKWGKFDSTDEIDFKGDWVDEVCYEFISSDTRAVNQAGVLHLIARAELFVEKTEMQDSQVLRKMGVWKAILLSGLSVARLSSSNMFWKEQAHKKLVPDWCIILWLHSFPDWQYWLNLLWRPRGWTKYVLLF